MNDGAYNTLLKLLESAAAAHHKPDSPRYRTIVEERTKVFARYQPVFSLQHIPNLTEYEFKSFLYPQNNRHWSGLYRTGLRALEDMAKLRSALSLLLDESKAIGPRFTESVSMVNGMGKGIATAILTVAYPDRYGVWNNTAEGALQQEGLWPNFGRNESIGDRYERINNLLLRLSSDLKIDLWELDHLWCFVLVGKACPPDA